MLDHLVRPKILIYIIASFGGPQIKAYFQFSNFQTLQQKVSLYAKWFHWILNECTCPSEWDLVAQCCEFISTLNRDKGIATTFCNNEMINC
jgi:hypothetical protein